MIDLVRVRNWDVHLVRRARELVGEPYTWGATDCGSIVIEALGTVYGSSPLGDLAWDGPRSAQDALDALGGVQGALERLTARQVPLSFAQTSDVLVVPSGEHLARLHVIVVGQALTSTPKSGVVLWKLADLDLPDDAMLWRLP